MSIAPQKFREIVLQILYSYDSNKQENEGTIPLLMMELAVSKKTVLEAQRIASTIFQHKEELDQQISRISQSYDFNRIQRIERNVLRLGLYELKNKEVPPKVVISEAMRLCRKFTSPEAGRFVNAILDASYKESLGEKASPEGFQAVVEALEESERRIQNIVEKKRLNNGEDDTSTSLPS